jgi:hypothetical protein
MQATKIPAAVLIYINDYNWKSTSMWKSKCIVIVRQGDWESLVRMMHSGLLYTVEYPCAAFFCR